MASKNGADISALNNNIDVNQDNIGTLNKAITTNEAEIKDLHQSHTELTGDISKNENTI